MTSHTLSHQAYLKMVLHAAKYPASAVDGLLLGTGEANTVTILDALPLRHLWLELSPVLEIGLAQAETYAKGKGWRVVGYYCANADIQDRALPVTGARVASVIRDSFPSAVAFVLDNTKLSSLNPQIATMPFIYTENQWRTIRGAFGSGASSIFALEDKSSPARAALAVTADAHAVLWDFDAHLEDVARDWLGNGAIYAVVSK